MDKALYVAMTGARASLDAQARVAQNLANVDTAGFKALLGSTEAVPVTGPGFATRVDAKVSNQGFDGTGGTISQTGNPLDVALSDSNWITVQARDGSEAYTRAGALRVNANGLLTTTRGEPVMGEGGPISVPPHDRIEIGVDGTVSIVPQGQAATTISQVGRIKVIRGDATNLERRPDGLMRATAGNPTPAAGAVLTTGALEGSNVNPSSMLVEMIDISRRFEMQVRLLQSGDENAKAANSLLRVG